MIDLAILILPFALTVAITLAVLRGAHWLLLKRHAEMSNEKKFPRQLVMLGLTIVGIVAIALALPVDITTRNQLIAFVGLVVSGIFAFSSTTLFANLMAGLMLRLTRPFRSGDFIRVRDHFGRVAERGLLDTEIQTETRELIAIPNTYLITNPVQVIRSSGTIISVSLSLGYDVHHARVNEILLQAARASGLEDPFVHVTELGNFAISYKVNGLLRNIKSVLTARSDLSTSVLDALHGEGIEIVSPSFMNQRPQQPDQKMIPHPVLARQPAEQVSAEDIAFDKAEEAERRERQMEKLQQQIQELEEQAKEADDAAREHLAAKIEQLRAALQDLEKEPPRDGED